MAGTTRSLVVREAATLVDQLRVMAEWLSHLSEDEHVRPSVLPGWDVRTLCEHILTTITQFDIDLETAAAAPASATRPLPRSALMQPYWHEMESAQTGPVRTGSEADSGPSVQIDTVIDRLGSVLQAAMPRAIETRHGPAKPADLVRAQIVHAVVHADDLSQSLPERCPVPTPRRALGTACRTLADILAEEHPGRSVEVRVPPSVAVQCGTGSDGPTHTRGTPPNVIESDPMIFLRLAIGRLTWEAAEAEGLVSASGQRADLSGVLPVIS